MMNAKPGEYAGLMDLILYTAKGGPQAFYKGTIPSACRILPMNVLVFVFYEQLRLNFGYFPTKPNFAIDKKQKDDDD